VVVNDTGKIVEVTIAADAVSAEDLEKFQCIIHKNLLFASLVSLKTFLFFST